VAQQIGRKHVTGIITQYNLIKYNVVPACNIYKGKDKGKAVPLEAWIGPEGSRKLRFPDYMTTAQDDV